MDADEDSDKILDLQPLWIHQHGHFKETFAPPTISKKKSHIMPINFFLASGDFYHLLIMFANSLDPAQD